MLPRGCYCLTCRGCFCCHHSFDALAAAAMGAMDIVALMIVVVAVADDYIRLHRHPPWHDDSIINNECLWQHLEY